MFKRKTTALMSAFSIAIMLSACQPKSKQDEPNINEPAASEVVVETKHLNGEIQRLNLGLPKCDGNNCSELVVERLSSNYPFIDAWVDEKIASLLAETLSDAPQDNTKIQADDTNAASEVVGVSAKLKLEQKLATYKNAFLALDQELKALSAGHPINVMIKPKILNAEEPVATVVLNSSSYLGGAHGSTSQLYYNFDLNTEKRLLLSDLLEPNKANVLKEKFYAAFKTWVIDSELTDNVEEYEQAWPFKMTDNFYLGKQGLILQYGEYEMGPYVVGLPRLVIPYNELEGILKPEYLPEALRHQSAASEVQP